MLSYVWIFDDCSVCGRHILEAIVLDRESIDCLYNDDRVIVVMQLTYDTSKSAKVSSRKNLHLSIT